MAPRPDHGRRSARRSVELRPRVSLDLKARVEAAAAARGMTVNRWMEQLLERAAPPVLDLSAAPAPDSSEEAAVA